MSIVDDLQQATEGVAGEAARRVLAIYRQWKAGEITLDDAVLLIAAALNRANATAVTLGQLYLVSQIEELAGVPVLSTGSLPVDESERLIKAVGTVLTEPPKTKLTRTAVRDLIRSAGLDPDVWDIPTITARVNESIRDSLPDPDDLDYVPDMHQFQFEDFIETVNEHPRKLSERGLFPPPPPGTPEYEQWKIDSPVPEIDSDDYTHMPPIWEAEPDNAEMRLERLARAEPLEAAQQAAHTAMQSHDLVEGWTRQMDADPCQLCRWWWREGRVWPKEHPFQSHKGCNCQPTVVLAEQIQSTGYTRQLERNRAS